MIKRYKFIWTVLSVLILFCGAVPTDNACALRPLSSEERNPFTFGDTVVLHDGAMKVTPVMFRKTDQNGDRFAQGWVVVMRPGAFDIRAMIEPKMVGYDFFNNAITPDMAVSNSAKTGRVINYQELPGWTVSGFADMAEQESGRRPDFVVPTLQNCFWGNCTIVIMDGKFIRKTAPGLFVDTAAGRPIDAEKMKGDYYCLVLNKGMADIMPIPLQNGEPACDISSIELAFSGPALMLPGQNPQEAPEDVSGQITFQKDEKGAPVPLLGPFQTNWPPDKTLAAFSEWGVDAEGNLIFIGLGGDSADHPAISETIRETLKHDPRRRGEYYKQHPKVQYGVLCRELIPLARQFGVRKLILGPGSTDVGAYIKGMPGRLISTATGFSETAEFYDKKTGGNGRPVGMMLYAYAHGASIGPDIMAQAVISEAGESLRQMLAGAQAI